jgi:hypothetical protein
MNLVISKYLFTKTVNMFKEWSFLFEKKHGVILQPNLKGVFPDISSMIVCNVKNSSFMEKCNCLDTAQCLK